MTSPSFAVKLAGARLESGAGPHILLPALPRHAGFVNGLLEATMEAYVRDIWQDEKDVDAYFARNAFEGRKDDTLIIQQFDSVGEPEPSGAVTAHYVQTASGETAIDLGEIHIRPELQGEGLGRAVIALVQQFAAPLPVTLIVLENNPARTLYERLGFEVTGKGEGDTAYRLHMMWRP